MKLIDNLSNQWGIPLFVLLSIVLYAGIPELHWWVIPTFISVPYYLLFANRFFQRYRQFKSRLVRLLAIFVSTLLTIIFFTSLVSSLFSHSDFSSSLFIYILIFLTVIDLSDKTFLNSDAKIDPTVLFVFTFAGVIFIGAILLMLPNSTTQGITFIDALFTSTSAVCVTGLAVLDTGKGFTTFGQFIILILIQVGGLGILTFTNVFGVFFRTNRSFKNILLVQNLVGSDSLSENTRVLLKIIVFTFVIEGLGALFIYFYAPDFGIFFAVFHSISAFCNAGFSPLSASLYESSVRFNYGFHTTVAILIILGGIGYSVLLATYNIIHFRIEKIVRRLLQLVPPHYSKSSTRYEVNARLVLWTTAALLVFGMLTFYVFEANGTLREHPTFLGKLAVSFFGSVTPRTAGFNSVDIAAMSRPMILIYLLLMWVGASPGSTGGGIKTTTFAIASMNIFNHIRGINKMVIRWQYITRSLISQTSVIISLSLIAIGTGTCIIAALQPELDVLQVAFECFSAYGTVGLTMGITFTLSTESKIVIILLMFLGRVSFYNFLIGIFSFFTKPPPEKRIHFPDAKILIN
ncbi:MAG TPA: ATPase [Bacteroidetes bacterium]|nr:ATPase [Bacteroidota bacterium]HRR09470.1 potassium transporter TrkG [Rhodothermales bacterium]